MGHTAAPHGLGVRLVGTGVLLLWAMAIGSYSVADAAWSTSGTAIAQGSAMHNWLGVPGAYWADICLYLFGRNGSYGLVGVGLLMLHAPAWRVSSGTAAALPATMFAVVLLEWLAQSQLDPALPAGAGGVVGKLLGEWLLVILPGLQQYQSALIVMLLACVLAGVARLGRFSWWQTACVLGQGVLRLRAGRLAAASVPREEPLMQAHIATVPAIEALKNAASATLMSASAQQVQGDAAPLLYPDRDRQEALVADAGSAAAAATVQQSPGAQGAQAPQAPPAHDGSKPREPLVYGYEVSKRLIRESQSGLFDDEQVAALPRIDLLDARATRQELISEASLELTSRLIEKKLSDFGVQVRVVTATPGPVITRYEIEPATGVKGAQVVNLARDLARSLSLSGIRVLETIPGKNLMALELPNARRESIRLSEILGSDTYNNARSLLTLGLGKDIVGMPVIADLAKMPHCLVAGTTGAGKSVGINAMILSLLYKAQASDMRLLLIDPKMLEMSVYEGIPHLIAPVVTDMRQAAHGLNWCVAEMERRYRLMSRLGVRNLAGFNARVMQAVEAGEPLPNPFSLDPAQPEPLEKLAHIVVVIDELADLMMVVGKKIEELIARLAQKARAAGIHLILATQRPSVDVITGLIKANIPTRIAFQVSSKVDSRTILDQMGAESLLGMGDMLYLASGTGVPVRVHGAFVSDEEVHRVVAYLRQHGQSNYIEGVLDGGEASQGEFTLAFDEERGGTTGERDPLYDRAVEIVLKNRKPSISLVQRHLKVGYNRAARMLEDMQAAGLVSALTSSGQRDLLVSPPPSDE